jgi:hypothetical protein
MICLNNYITLYNGCTPTVPTSGFYISDLEGLSIGNIAAIAPEELQSAANVVAEKTNFAGLIVENRLKAILNARGIKLNTLGKLYTVCDFSTVADIPVAANRGIRVSKKWLQSVQSRIWVESIRIKSAIAGATTLYVTDPIGVVLWSTPTVLQADTEHVIHVKKYFAEDIILITSDNAAIAPYLTTCDASSNCKPCGDFKLNVEGWNGINTTTNGYLSACVRLDCVDTDIICQFLDRLGLAILYQSGAQILKEWISPNNRLNLIKTHGIEWALQTANVWESQSIEYLDNEIDNIIQLLETDKFCYRCERRLRMYPMLPG